MADIAKTIASILNTSPDRVTDILSLKMGMTNQSFLFCFNGEKYIFRLPGVGTDQLVNRRQEVSVYRTIAGKNICSDLVYIDEAGYKITSFLDNARVCDPNSEDDVRKCISSLRLMHNMHLKVDHIFDLRAQIDKYEELWQGKSSIYRDYIETKQNALSLFEYIDSVSKDVTLTHIDAVPDNFLIIDESRVELIDWEYAGMQDPHIDIAMFAIYSFYDRKQIDRLIDIYFEDSCPPATRAKIYCYVSLCGLLWSNWCEYKRQLGHSFGDYALKQYCYAKEFYDVAKKELNL